MREYLPLLLLLACPLMMLFMMRGHAGHQGHHAGVAHGGDEAGSDERALQARNAELEARLVQLEAPIDELEGPAPTQTLAPVRRSA